MEQLVHLIKTLDEGVQLPNGTFFNVVLQCFSEFTYEDEIVDALKTHLSADDVVVNQLLNKLFDLAVIEFFDDELPEALNRYHRQLLLFDAVNPKNNFEENYGCQSKLRQTHVLVLGIGGIGNFIATSLAASGVGHITLVDFDVVEISNLNRQILFTENDLGNSKVHAAANRLKAINQQCIINAIEKEIHSLQAFEKLLKSIDKIDYVVLSADKPVDMVLWASALCKPYKFKYLKCGYMAYQGLIGPLLGYNTKPYDEIYQSWAVDIQSQDALIHAQNEKHIAPSMAATNAILANIATWELLKDITGICESVLIEQRILFNLKTMEMRFG